MSFKWRTVTWDKDSFLEKVVLFYMEWGPLMGAAMLRSHDQLLLLIKVCNLLFGGILSLQHILFGLLLFFEVIFTCLFTVHTCTMVLIIIHVTLTGHVTWTWQYLWWGPSSYAPWKQQSPLLIACACNPTTMQSLLTRHSCSVCFLLWY